MVFQAAMILSLLITVTLIVTRKDSFGTSLFLDILALVVRVEHLLRILHTSLDGLNMAGCIVWNDAFGWGYIIAMILRASESAVTSASVALTAVCGQMPRADRNRVARDAGIISPVRGMAIRLVSRK